MPKSNDPANATLGGLLSALAEQPEIRGTWFNKKTIKLDGYKFVECRFDNCELKVSSTNIYMERCFIDENTTVIWMGEIVKPIRLFNSRYDWIYQTMPYFAPTRNPDGTITIAE